MDDCSINDTSSPLSADQHMDFVGEALRMAAYTASFLFALPINGYVLWLILRGQPEKIASDFIPLNQTVVEIIFSLLFVWYFLKAFLLQCFFFWRMFLFTSSVFLIARPLAQSFLCLEQYLAAIHPVTFIRYKPLRYRLTCGCVSWLIVFILSIINAMFDFSREAMIMMAALYLYSMLLMTFCCLSVLRALRRRGPGEGQKDSHKGNMIKRRAFKIILINLIHSTLSQMSLAVVALLSAAIPSSRLSVVVSMNLWTFVFTGFVPALLYLKKVRMMNKKYCL